MSEHGIRKTLIYLQSPEGEADSIRRYGKEEHERVLKSFSQEDRIIKAIKWANSAEGKSDIERRYGKERYSEILQSLQSSLKNLRLQQSQDESNQSKKK